MKMDELFHERWQHFFFEKLNKKKGKKNYVGLF
jgi:hypothetical protein